MGTVDRPTAVYLKALREYGKIGPHRRPAYQLKPMTEDDDFASPDVGARYLRDTCTGRSKNIPGQKGHTVPEIVALQFFGNESRLVFTGKVDPFHTRAEHKQLRHTVMGIDTNAHRRGSFDAVFHAGGDWYTSRGWGVGQATDTDIALDGVQLRRGLPVLPPDAETIVHPKPFVDRFASVQDAIDRKILPKYDRTDRRDCTFSKVQGGNYYDCRTCLKRFYDDKMTGAGDYGEGGVFVPVSKAILGSVRKASGFFIDFERYTPYARGKDGVEDPSRRELYTSYFALELPDPDPDVVAVLRRMNGATTIEQAVVAVTQGRPLDKKALKAERKALAGKVLDHVKVRSQLPCSWLLVRMRYAGTGEQAFSSLFDLLKVVGNLETNNKVLIKHIEEASELRRK